ncbi:ribonucleoprotein PTB-binding 2 isoform X2 [Patella vulgata]|uniref:ribonucleoprotein PTB-binding 2 isoform X2 n=1 Tax=Patella vulgata TaxID=6465 RepID=UPI00217FCB18|nr:ribonucleoprotein PTB-binding 2 isoform X2 [Patella vulgata]
MAATSKGTHALPNKSSNTSPREDNGRSKNDEKSAPTEGLQSVSKSEDPTQSGRIRFNQGRKIQIKNIPPNSNRKDIEQLLQKYDVKDVDININVKQAIVTLNDGCLAEEVVHELDGQSIKDTPVSVCILPYTNLLCIAHLPKHFTDQDFSDLVTKYSTVERCFLMRFETTGESLHYGFVQFNEEVDWNDAKEEFDWRVVEGCQLHAEYVDICTDYSKLYSRCLFISNLPKSFKEAYKLREIFNCIASPIYCQIMLKDNESLGYGIIEYKQASEARDTWFKLSDYKLQDVSLNVSFCVPDKPAVFIYNRIMLKLESKNPTKGSLLPDPVITNPVSINNPLVKGLANQSPELMKNFMQALNHLQTVYQNQITTPSNKPGLLGPAPSLPLSPAMNPNMQLGLMIFLATQMQNKLTQQFTGPLAAQLNILQKLGQQKNLTDVKPSLLGDPLTSQANLVIQTLTAQVKGNQNITQILQNTRDLNLNLLMNLGQIMSNIQNKKKPESILTKNIPPPQSGLFPTPMFPPSNNNQGKGGPNANGNSFLQNIQGNLQKQFTSNAGPKPLMANFQQLSAMKSNPTSLLGEPPAYLPKVQNLNASKGMSMGSGYPSLNRASESSSYGNRGSYSGGQDYGQYNDSGYWADNTNDSTSEDPFQDIPSKYQSGTDYRREDIYNQYPMLNTNTNKNDTLQQQKYPAIAPSAPRASNYQTNTNELLTTPRTTYSAKQVDYTTYTDYNKNTNSLFPTNSVYNTNNTGAQINNYSGNRNILNYQDNSSYNIRTANSDYDFNSMQPSKYPTNSSSNYKFGYQGSNYKDESFNLDNSSSYTPAPPPSSYVLKTPVGQKRSYSQLLPAPEPSPEGSYIGQHSQGLGGHYADSYSKRIKLDDRFQ